MLFCHPASFTPVCTTEFAELARRQEEFDELGVELLALSVDSVYSHINWIEWIKTKMNVEVQFPVIENLSVKITKAYGMLDQSSLKAATVSGCYFVDTDQIVQTVIHYPMHVGRSINEILRVQRALMDTHQNDYSTPVDWRPGEPYLQTSLNTKEIETNCWSANVVTQRTGT